MKYWMRWIIAAIILLLLVVRMIYKKVNKFKDEREWYRSELHYKFSARVDTMVWSGVALVEITGGEFNPHREFELKEQLKAHGELFAVFPQDGKYNLRIPYAGRKGDSVYVDSDADILSLYRGDSLIVTRPFSVSLRESPF